ncbi:MAG: DNA polymerase III subunit chi [Rhodobacteraceae bacterium]|nr:DNA polymerase III subunit chi [Paracoccaceae bacterium]
MVKIFFYQSDGPPTKLLFSLLEKSRSQNWSILVSCSDQNEVEFLHDQLWVQPDDHFLGIGIAGSEFDRFQPVLLSEKPLFNNDPQVMIVTGKSTIEADVVTKFTRIMIVFNRNDQKELAASREKWKSLSGLGHHMQLYCQDRNGWTLKAEVNQEKKEVD